LPDKRKEKKERGCIGGAATKKEREKEERRVRRCTKHFYNKACDL